MPTKVMLSRLKKRFRSETFDSQVRKLSGQVLEIGCGSKVGNPQYTRRCAVTMIEKSPQRAEKLIKDLASFGSSAAKAIQADAACLPFPNSYFDAVVGSFVLCSVEDVGKVLKELSRVSKPGAKFLFLEHIPSKIPFVKSLMSALTPVSVCFCNNCHLNSEPLFCFKKSAFEVEEALVSGELFPWLFVSGIRK